MKTVLLLQLEQRLSTTLAEMARFIKDQFDFKVSTQAISNLIHDMDILWKQVTNIPAAWNKPNLLNQQANFVNWCGLDLGRTVVFVNESGFDLHSGWAFGYSPSGIFLFCSLLVSVIILMFLLLDSRPACCLGPHAQGQAGEGLCSSQAAQQQ